jgi:hypothetical protein
MDNFSFGESRLRKPHYSKECMSLTMILKVMKMKMKERRDGL